MKKLTFMKSQALQMITQLGNIIQSLDESKKYDVEIKEHRERRSLDANAYFWVLCGKLAECTGIEKDVIYRDLIKNIGGNSEIICVRDNALNKLRSGWEHNGIGWVTETMPSKIAGCTNVILYTGSSVYDTKQMSRLIELIVFECKSFGIETATPNEIERMLSLWQDQ